jgi:hypothetical protein
MLWRIHCLLQSRSIQYRPWSHHHCIKETIKPVKFVKHSSTTYLLFDLLRCFGVIPAKTSFQTRTKNQYIDISHFVIHDQSYLLIDRSFRTFQQYQHHIKISTDLSEHIVSKRAYWYAETLSMCWDSRSHLPPTSWIDLNLENVAWATSPLSLTTSKNTIWQWKTMQNCEKKFWRRWKF